MATTTTTSSKSPWEPIVPYLTGQNGILPTAQQNFQNAQWSPAMSAATNAYLGQLGNSQGATQLSNAGTQLLNNGLPSAVGYTPAGANSSLAGPAQQAQFNSTGPANIAQFQSAGPAALGSAASGSAAQARFDLANLGLGSAPQDAYNRMLTGKADTSTLDPVVQAALRRTTDAFNESVMPSIRGGAQAAGQYGGSRQGIAEGIAAKGLSQSLADASAGMYNSAYDRAQGMMANAAGQLGGFSTNIANNNAAMQTQASLANAQNATHANLANASAQNAMAQFNAGQSNNLGLANANILNNLNQFNAGQANQMGQFNAGQANSLNQFNAGLDANLDQFNAGQINQANQFNSNLGLQNNNQYLQGLNTAGNLINSGMNATNSNYLNTMQGLNAQNQFNNANLNQYANLVNQAAGQGGSASQSTPYYTNQAANNLGLASGLVGIGTGLSNLFGWNK